MTRPKAAGTTLSERKRQAILAAASALFLRQGYAGTSVDQVAAEADVSKQTVYAQFNSKEALFLAMVHSMTDGAAGQVQQGLDQLLPGETLNKHLCDYAVRLIQVARTPPLMQLRRLAIAEAERFPELGKAVHDLGPGRAIAGLAAAIAGWSEQGLLHAPDPQQAASNFNWLVMGEPVNRAMLLGAASVPGPGVLKRHAQEAVRVFMAAYGSGG